MSVRTRGPVERSDLSTPLKWTLSGIGFVLVTGTLSHFVFEWAGRWAPLGLVFPVNESVWEHLKLAFWPMLAWALVERGPLRGKVNNFLTATVTGVTAAIATITLFFYAYTGIVGHDVMWLDILDFVVSVVLGYYVRLRILTSPQAHGRETTAKVVLGVLLVAFLTFTFFPPATELFRDPRSGGYGIMMG